MTVAKGPVLENIDRDDEVDVLKFPVPFLHEHDGGRYIGTDDLVIMRDPEESWVNCGTYRVMVHDANRVVALDVAGQARPPDSREVFSRRASRVRC